MKYISNLYTKEFENLNINSPLAEYPYPQFKRDSYYSLNGIWNYKISKDLIKNLLNKLKK